MSHLLQAPTLRVSGFLALLGLASIAMVARSPEGHALVPGNSSTTIDGRTLIDSLPFTITDCGSYVVTGCLVGTSGSNGIEISASDVTLDLNGNTLRGVDGSLVGILVSPGAENISISGGTIRGWRQGGLVASDARLIVLRNLRALDNNQIGLSAGEGSELSRCIVERTRGTGIVVGESSRVTDCSSSRNLQHGVVVAKGSLVSTTVGNENDGDGISVVGLIQACMAEGNYRDGIVVDTGALLNSTASSNGRHAMRAGQRSLIRDCSASLSPTSEANSSAFALGSHCYLGESRMDLFSGHDGILISGQNTAIERCSFSAWNSNAWAVRFIGSNNFIGDSVYHGFGGLINGPTGNNVLGVPSNSSPGFTNNASKFGSINLNF